MNYWPACQTNLMECEQPLFNFIRGLIKPGEVTAKAYFGTRGWTTSVSGNPFGFTSPLDSEDMSWNFSPFAGPWLATHLWNHYDYTRDRKWLANEAYDIIKGAADFAADYLWHRAKSRVLRHVRMWLPRLSDRALAMWMVRLYTLRQGDAIDSQRQIRLLLL